MRGFAEYTIVGRVGKITEAGPTLKISIAAEYGRKDEGGEFRQNTFWNTVTVFREGTIKWLKDNVRPGDIVCAKGTIRETSYDKNGEPDKQGGFDHQNDATGYPIAFEMPVKRPVANVGPIRFL